MQRTTPRRSPHLAVQPDYRGLMLSLQVRCLLQVLGFRRRHHGHQAAHLNCRARPHRHSDRSQCEAPHLILSRRMPRLQPSVQRILRNNQWLVLTAASRRVPALTVTGFCSCIRQAWILHDRMDPLCRRTTRSNMGLSGKTFDLRQPAFRTEKWWIRETYRLHG